MNNPVSIDDYPEIEAAIIFADPPKYALRQLVEYCDARLMEAIMVTVTTGERVWASDVLLDIARMLRTDVDYLHTVLGMGRTLVENERRAALTPEERQAEDEHEQWIDDNIDQLAEEYEEFDPEARADWQQFWDEREAHRALTAQFNEIIEEGMA